MKIKVSTDALKSAADTIDARTSAVSGVVEDLITIIDNSNYYWEGNGQTAHVSHFKRKMDRIEQAIARYRENAQDLREAAGIYDSTERVNASVSDMLTGDVLL